MSRTLLVAVVVAALVAALVGAGAAVFVTERLRAHDQPGEGPAMDGAALADLRSRIELLDRRLGEVGSQNRTGESIAREPARTVVETPAAAGPAAASATPAAELRRLEGRIVTLEKDVSGLALQVRGLGPIPDTVAGIKQALKDKNLHGYNVPKELVQRRLELRRRLLELAPGDPEAAQTLCNLKTDYLLMGNPTAAREVLETYGQRVSMDSWRLDMEHAEVSFSARNLEDAAARYFRIAMDSNVPSYWRASASFRHAYALKEDGRYVEARRYFQELINRFDENDPRLRDSVSGARRQLERIAVEEKARNEQKARRQGR